MPVLPIGNRQNRSNPVWDIFNRHGHFRKSVHELSEATGYAAHSSCPGPVFKMFVDSLRAQLFQFQSINMPNSTSRFSELQRELSAFVSNPPNRAGLRFR
jgi:hypothetical protein